MSLCLSLKLMKDVLARPSYQAAISISRTMSGSNKDNDKDPEKSINTNIPMVDFDDPDYLPLPQYPAKINEPLEQKRQRLLYQSRKRGMLENDLLLATFASKFLKNMDEEHLKLYDQLINGPTNDWDIYYWATENKPTPAEYETSVMKLLKEHAKNVRKEQRLRQPNLF